MPSESQLHAHIAAKARDLGPFCVTGPGDDCAALRAFPNDPAASLLITVDQLIESRHFTPETPLDLIARKAIARSVSDIAACAGTPAWSLATGALPTTFPTDKARELIDALNRWARHFACPIVGGDLASTPPGTPLHLSITVAGTPHPTRGAVLRSAAKPGDALWITGAVGNSFASGRHITFQPRIREAQWLADTLGPDLHAMIDLSDGLGRDASRIARASTARLIIHHIPLHPPNSDTLNRSPLQAASDGEDYELLFTTPAHITLPPTIPHTNTPLTRIGTVEPGQGCVIIDPQGHPHDAEHLGWDHQ